MRLKSSLSPPQYPFLISMHHFVSSRPILYRRARIPAAPASTIGTPVAAAPALLEDLAAAAPDVLEALASLVCAPVPVWLAADELAELNAFAAELAAEAALVAADALADTTDEAEAEDEDLAV
jgi:hypothetical protein